jgi:hypothetical protein
MALWQAWEEECGAPQDVPFWATVWPAAQLLARVVQAEPLWVRGQTVLDLGCGSGVAGIAALDAGAGRVVAHDIDPVALAIAARNARANAVELLLQGPPLLHAPCPLWSKNPNALPHWRLRKPLHLTPSCTALCDSPYSSSTQAVNVEVKRGMDWKKLLGSITKSVDEELRLRNEYLLTENRMLRQRSPGRIQLTDSDRHALAEIGRQLGRQTLEEIATVAKPATILAWHRKFASPPSDLSQQPKSVGRPRIDREIEELVVRMARENRSWGYDRIVGALANVGYTISDQTVGNILKRHSILPAPERTKTVTWREFIRIHLDMLEATDFFTSELWSGLGLLIFPLLWCIHFGRQHVNAMGRSLHQWRHEVRSLMLRVLHGRAPVQRGVYEITTCTRSEAIRYSTGLQCMTLSACTSDAERPLRTQAMGKVVCVSTARAKQIRDGPMPRRQQRNLLWKDDLRRAA